MSRSWAAMRGSAAVRMTVDSLWLGCQAGAQQCRAFGRLLVARCDRVPAKWVEELDGVKNPRAEYERRLAEYEAAYAVCERRHLRLGSVKLGGVAAGLVLLWVVAGERGVGGGWVGVSVGAFAAVAWGTAADG